MKTRKEIKNNLFLPGHHLNPVKGILEFMKKNEGQEFTPTAIKNGTGLAYNVVTATLNRLSKSGQIWKPHHGYYSMKCTLNKQQIEKIERSTMLFFHNISVKIPKNPKNPLKSEKEKQQDKGTMVVKITQIQNKSNGKNNVIEFGVNRKLTTLEYPKNYLVMVGCSQNPLNISEFMILSSLMKSIYGEAVDKGIIVKLDINNDLPMTFSPNQLTFGDISGMCFAIYGKGDKTRTELRNFNPNVPVEKFLKQLTVLFAPEAVDAGAEAEAVKAPEKAKPYVYGESKPPLSEFVTALELSKLYLPGYDWTKEIK